jgi:RNA polymerase-binding protein DksA
MAHTGGVRAAERSGVPTDPVAAVFAAATSGKPAPVRASARARTDKAAEKPAKAAGKVAKAPVKPAKPAKAAGAAAKPAPAKAGPASRGAAGKPAAKAAAKPSAKTAAKPAAKAPASKPASKPAAKAPAKKVAARPARAVKATSTGRTTRAARTPTEVTGVTKAEVVATAKRAGKPTEPLPAASAQPAEPTGRAAASPSARAGSGGGRSTGGGRSGSRATSGGTRASSGRAATPRAPAARSGGSGRSGGSDTPAVPPGTDWTTDELAEVRADLVVQLAQLRAEYDQAIADLNTLQQSANDGAGDDQADAGTKTFEREQELSIANNRLDLLTQMERAIERVDADTYGRCESCGDAIPKARLQAFPSATLCVTCKQREERR